MPEATRPLAAYDHIEQAPVPELAGVTDLGRRHAWNEDALALATEVVDGEPVYVLVVCDGVSSARDSQRMAWLAVEVTRAGLLDGARRTVDPQRSMREAIQAAHRELIALPEPAVDDDVAQAGKTQAPGCTIVAALVRSRHATIGWVGDSRAYTLGEGATSRLRTRDHSWVNEVVDAGLMSVEDAARSPDRNAITRCLGPLGVDAPGQMPEVDVEGCDVATGEMLLLCSDGLWKYADEPAELAQLATAALPLDIARHMVTYANERGGSDNITAVVLRLP